MAINGLNRLVIADENGNLTGKPLASARAAAEQMAVEKITEAKSEIRSAAVQEAEQVATEKVAAVKSEAVQAATESVASALPAKISEGITQAKGDIVKAATESVSGTIDTKISEGIEQARTSIVSETLDSVDQTIDGKIDAAKTDILKESEKNVAPAVARAIADANIGERNHGFGQRNISMVTYYWPDYYNRDQPGKVSQWDKTLLFGDTLGIVILNKSSGNWGDKVDNDFLTQGKLAEAAGAKYVAFYLQTRYGANSEFATSTYFERIRKNLNVSADAVREDTEEAILAQVRNLVTWYKNGGGLRKFAIFLDEVVNGWDEEQKAIMPYYKRLYGKIKEIAGQDTLVIINPGSNTRPEMMDACDIALTYESNAQKYIDAKVTDIHPRHYDGIPSWRFWHVVHGITKDNVDAVFAKADKAGIGHLYATDRNFAVGNGNEDEPDQNPYDKAPAEWVADRAKAWINNVLPFEQRVSQLETIQVVNNRAYSMPEGTDIAGFFLQSGAVHPAGVLWQTAGNAAPSSGLVILVRAGGQVYGYVPGAAAVAPSPNTPQPAQPPVPQPAPGGATVAAPQNLRIAQAEGGITVSWDAVPGATGYEISVDGGDPVPATSPYTVQATGGKSGIIQVRAKKDSTASAWAQQSYMVAEVTANGKPIKWLFIWAHAGWAETGKVLKNFWYAPKLDTSKDGRVQAFQYAVSSVTGEPLQPPNNVKIDKQYLATADHILEREGDRIVLEYTGELPRLEDAPSQSQAWEYTMEIEKRAIHTRPAENGDGRIYHIAEWPGFDPRWANNPNIGHTSQPVLPGDRGIEIKREDGIITYSVIRADGAKVRLLWFAANDTLKPSSRLSIHGWRWGTLTGTYYSAGG